eukprot:TRINITY_DN3570_c0_g4_i1.p1 TRINITY_DN3570_c0_g4~~TRINITY_DN3570_c0_g4_i1.p1  ORF type:complete len:847 (+),score=213.39 TRINITY_DN3570_c0_g4_i1:3-2543(+)
MGTAKFEALNLKSGSGGAILYGCRWAATKCNLNFVRTNFISNYAEKSGGAIKWDESELFFDDQTSFVNNAAVYGPNVASYPVYLQKWDNTSLNYIPFFTRPRYSRLLQSTTFGFSGVASGNNFSYIAILIDHYGYRVRSDNTSVARFLQKEGIILENMEVRADQGAFVFSELTITSRPGTSFSLKLETDAIPTFVYSGAARLLQTSNDSAYASLPGLPFSISLRECVRGEVMTFEGRCRRCPQNYYINEEVVTPEIYECIKCPETAVCLGSDIMGPLAGYWRLNILSKNVMECPFPDSCLGFGDMTPIGNESSCPQGTTLLADQCVNFTSYSGNCLENYEGILCYACVKGFAKNEEGTCVPCSNNTIYWLRVCIVILLAIWSVISQIRATLDESLDYEEISCIYQKIFNSFAQVVQIIATLPLAWPTIMLTFNAGQSQVFSAPQNLFTFECFYGLSIWQGADPFYLKVTVTSLTPLVFSLMIPVGLSLIYYITKRDAFWTPEIQNDLKSVTIASITILIFFMHPEIIFQAMSLFQCTNVGDDDHPYLVLSEAYQVECWTPSHIKWLLYLGLPSLIFWGLGIPLFVYRLLRVYREEIDSEEVLEKFSFIVKGYRKETYYWEVVVTYRKIFLIFISVMMTNYGPFAQGLFVLLILTLSWVLQEVMTPYQNYELNNLERYSLIASIAYTYFSLYFLTISEEASLLLRLFLATIMFVVYGFFLAYYWVIFGFLRFKEINEENNQPILLKILPHVERRNIIFVSAWAGQKRTEIENILREKREKFMENLKAASERRQNNRNPIVTPDPVVIPPEEDEFLQIKRRKKEVPQISRGIINSMNYLSNKVGSRKK